ncbi:guanylate kinase [Silvimonas iriomotensis]|uniref:Guanylate kinase n=1 Tax=Silvimonas iriomotensis TaxID=449662 RepID=A0ABQ2PB36_9NEIS|nr:guanylate kinase [Silvimonas iriomotensis]GGP22548.1 guanylate kinase [Silvimonas iriomotensis]
MAKGTIFVVTAPSGAGKTTLVAALLAADQQIQLSISFTSRPARAGEVNGKDYHFVDRATFEGMVQAGDFVEWAEVYGNYYGTSRKWLESVIDDGRDILLEIDWQGAQQVKKLFPDSVGVFVLPPSINTLEQRLRARGKDPEDVIQRRMSKAREEMGHVSEAQYVIINEHIDDAVRDIISVVRAERLRGERQAVRHAELVNSLKA